MLEFSSKNAALRLSVLAIALSSSACVLDSDAAIEQLEDGAVASVADPVDDQTPAPSPTPTPTPTAPPKTVTSDEGFVQLEKIATNFDSTTMFADRPLPGDMGSDIVGAFRFICQPSHNLYDDPIVFPGQPGKAHLHTFYGNTEANANSTYESLRTSGDSTCRNAMNRSAYWMPAMLNGRGGVVMPEYTIVYYKRVPADNERCQREKACIGLPRGLRYVFGNTSQGAVGDNKVSISCSDLDGTSGNKYDNIPQAAAECEVGGTLYVGIHSPECWNGTDLDSLDHRSHMADSVRNAETNWKKQCPTSHPYLLPKFTLRAKYTIDETLDRSGDLSTSRQTWHFSSDRMEGKTPHIAGTTFHGDWFGAWDDEVLEEWVKHCIDGFLSCNDANLGAGRGLRNLTPKQPTMSGTVPMPARPVA